MPLIMPDKNESQDDFIERCMSDDTMKKEYPDKDQRLAMCFSQWKKERKSIETNIEWEKRSYSVEVRVETIGEKKKIRGYAAMFNEWSDPIMGYFREIIRRGAFKKTIQENDIRALFNHDPNYVLGRTKNGTLELEEDRKGLAIAIDPPNTIWARDLTESIERGDIDQMSFQFKTIKDKWHEEDKNDITRELLEAKLYDISPVTFPAYPKTTVAVRSKVEELINSKEPLPAGHLEENEKVKKESILANHSRREELEKKYKYKRGV